jgi:hypothetical protein
MSDFMRLLELAERSGFKQRSIRNQYHGEDGVLKPILTKFGGRLGCWRADWEKFVAQRQKLGDNLSTPHAQAASIKTPNTQQGTTNDGQPTAAE